MAKKSILLGCVFAVISLLIYKIFLLGENRAHDAAQNKTSAGGYPQWTLSKGNNYLISPGAQEVYRAELVRLKLDISERSRRISEIENSLRKKESQLRKMDIIFLMPPSKDRNIVKAELRADIDGLKHDLMENSSALSRASEELKFVSKKYDSDLMSLEGMQTDGINGRTYAMYGENSFSLEERLQIERDVSERMRIIARIKSRLIDGGVAYNAPKEIPVGGAATIKLIIGVRTPLQGLKSQVEGFAKENPAAVGEVVTRRLKVSDNMIARVQASGEDFEVRSINMERQTLTEDKNTAWEWELRPKRPGQHLVHVVLEAVYQVGHKEEFESVGVYGAPIVVTASWISVISAFVMDKWGVLSGMAATLVTVTMTIYVFVRRIRSRRTQFKGPGPM